MQRSLAELVEVVGLADAIEITRRWGGRSWRVPAKVAIGDPLALTLGLETARRLVEHFGGVTLQLPSERNALLDQRNEAIYAEHMAGASMAALGIRYGLTRQGVAAVIRRAKDARPQTVAASRAGTEA